MAISKTWLQESQVSIKKGSERSHHEGGKIKVKKKENTCLPNKQTHRKRDQMVGYQRREEERRELEDSGPKVQAFSYK